MAGKSDRNMNLREPAGDPGLFNEFRDICQMENISVSEAVRQMMKNAIGAFKNPSKT